MIDLPGQRVVVMGLGRSGRAAARLAHAKGARVLGLDLRADVPPVEGVELELGPHRPEQVEAADLVVVSPGIPPGVPLLRAARQRGVPVVGELAFAASFLHAPTVAVTGTNGKSTVTWFTHQLLERAGMPCFVGGNLGNPLSNAVLAAEAPSCLVVEVSSYQLELAGSFRPDVGVILNLTPDHLARHGTMADYAAAKAQLFACMSDRDWAILPHGDDRLLRAVPPMGRRAWLGALPGVTRDGEMVHMRLGLDEAKMSLAGFAVPGSHNADNAACAALCAVAVGADPERVAAGLVELRALPHRMEVVAESHDVRWINDSKATNVDAARAGIRGLEHRAVVLLGGEGKPGHDGSLGMAQLVPDLARHRAVITFGASGLQIAAELRACGAQVESVGTLEEAVRRAAELVSPGDAVLLSPACASFDAFDDFEHRGRVFSALARETSP